MSDIGHNSVAVKELRSFFERWRRLEDAKKDIGEDLRELFAEARANGYDTKAMRAVFREQVGDAAARQEFDAVCDLYRTALASHARDAREMRADGGANVVTRHANIKDSSPPSSQETNTPGRRSSSPAVPVPSSPRPQSPAGADGHRGTPSPLAGSAKSTEPSESPSGGADVMSELHNPKSGHAVANPNDPGPIPAFLDRRDELRREKDAQEKADD